MRSLSAPLSLLLACAGCSAVAPRAPRWREGEWVFQGHAGLRTFERLHRSSAPEAVDAQQPGPAPYAAFVGQWKHGGDGVDYGAEGLLGLGWSFDSVSFSFDDEASIDDVDLELYFGDLGGGVFASAFLADKARVHVAAGPMIQLVSYSESDPAGGDEVDASGLGFGWYARTGIEVVASDGVMAGIGVRWNDTTTNLDDDRGDLRFTGLDWLLSISMGF